MLATRPTRTFVAATLQCGLLTVSFTGISFFAVGTISAQSATSPPSSPAPIKSQTTKARSHRSSKKEATAPVVETPPPPPPPNWPVNEAPSPASVVWDSNGLRINASNSSLQQILSDVSTETGSKVQGSVPDLRVFGNYGPGQARDVLSQLLQGSGYNVLLAGDLGKGAPREIVLSPRQRSGSNAPNGVNRPQQESDDDADESEDQPVTPPPPVQPPQSQNNFRPGFGPNGPIRTPQQIMEEMQQRQQQQQQQQQPQQQPPQQQPPQ